jgi:formate dehydrogenase major subunit
MHPLDLDAMGVKPGDTITVASRRGEIALVARADEGSPQGSIFIPFAFYEAAANVLTNAALDPFGKIAELKYCAVKIAKGGEVKQLATYGGGQSYDEPEKQALGVAD